MAKRLKKVLVVEDDPSMMKLLRKWLAVAGCTVFEAEKGLPALESAKKIQPDLILLDLMLPDIGGTEVVKRLKAYTETKDIPIIFMTAYMGVEKDKGDETLEVDGKKYPIFAKPLHNKKLLSAIRKSINRYRHGNDPIY